MENVWFIRTINIPNNYETTIMNRRSFIKTAGAFATFGSIGMENVACTASAMRGKKMNP
jgi:hypothetical protein